MFMTGNSAMRLTILKLWVTHQQDLSSASLSLCNALNTIDALLMAVVTFLSIYLGFFHYSHA